MIFKSPREAREFPELHPEVRAAAEDLDAHARATGLPELVVTGCIRTRAEQRAIYIPVGHFLLEAHAAGRILSPMQRRDLAQITAPGGTPEAIATWAEGRYSDHLVRCAVDFRNRHLKPPELAAYMHRLRTGRALLTRWQILSHDVGRGEHIHVGVRDQEWKSRFLAV